jgi:tRNA A37 threonylcarbamoyladenosine synthetase subunit TsaC/SUA5/YrdC
MHLRAKEDSEKVMDEMISDFNNRLAESHEERLKLVEEKSQIVKIDQEKNEIYRNSLMSFAEDLKPIKDFVASGDKGN